RDKLDGSAHTRAKTRDSDLRRPPRDLMPVGHLLHRGRALQPGTAAGRPPVAGSTTGTGGQPCCYSCVVHSIVRRPSCSAARLSSFFVTPSEVKAGTKRQ